MSEAPHAAVSALIWNVDPAVFSFSPLPRWYSLLFASGIVGGYLIIRGMFRRDGRPLEVLDSLLVHVILGMMIGMRLGHVLFYQPDYYVNHLAEIPMIWKGGYASHGGYLGVIISLLLFARRYRNFEFLWLADRVAIVSMFAGACIRVGNFFNSEMIGRPANDVPWAVIFQQIDLVPRHPAQLYESIGYFVITAVSYACYRWTAMPEKTGRLMGLVMGTGFLWRFCCEFFKEDQVPFESGLVLNMGQFLSIPFVVLGLAMAAGLHKRGKSSSGATATKVAAKAPVRAKGAGRAKTKTKAKAR